MTSRALDLMQREPSVASPSWDLAELESAFFSKGCSGFPVVRNGELVGVVSRSDLVRRVARERSREGEISDYFRDFGPPAARDEAKIAREEAHAIAEHLMGCTVADLMSPPTFVVEADDPIEAVADLMVRNHVHRVPVVEDGKLVGIISSLDLVALLTTKS